MTPEGKVKAEIKAYLREIGAYYFMPVQTGYGATGLDFFVCYQGQFYGIEVKRKGKLTATAMQRAVIQQIEQAGGTAFVTDNVEAVKWRLHESSPLPILPTDPTRISPGRPVA
jgi:hypothetical protein